MYTLEELKEKIKKDYKNFNLINYRLNCCCIPEFTLTGSIGDDFITLTYFWDESINSYISYFI